MIPHYPERQEQIERFASEALPSLKAYAKTVIVFVIVLVDSETITSGTIGHVWNARTRFERFERLERFEPSSEFGTS